MVYKWYILPIGELYGTYHLLREPGKSIDKVHRRKKGLLQILPRMSHSHQDNTLDLVTLDIGHARYKKEICWYICMGYSQCYWDLRVLLWSLPLPLIWGKWSYVTTSFHLPTTQWWFVSKSTPWQSGPLLVITPIRNDRKQMGNWGEITPTYRGL